MFKDRPHYLPWLGVSVVALIGIAGGIGIYQGRRWLKKSKQSKQRNEFLQAACDGDIDRLMDFIRAGQDLTCSDKNGSNALMLAAWAGRREAVLMLLHSGADVHALSHHGWTALTYAARAGEASTASALLEWGAQVNVIENTTGATPLMFAAFVGSLECVEILLDHGADPLIRTKQGALAYAFAEENGHEGIAGMLRHRAADAQAESQAMKEQQEALAARQKAKQAIMLRKKQEQAYIERLEEQRRKAAIERENYLASFGGQLETISVGCYVPLDKPTCMEMIRILIQSRWDQSIASKVYRPRGNSGSYRSQFEILHKDLLRRRALNALSRPLLNDLARDESDSGEEDSEEDSEEEDDDEGDDEEDDDDRDSDSSSNSGSGSSSKHSTGKEDSEGDSNEKRPNHVHRQRSRGPPVRLLQILDLLQTVFDQEQNDVASRPEMDPEDVSQLKWAVNAVSFGGEDDDNQIQDDSSSRAMENGNVKDALKVLHGLSGMSSSYLGSLHGSINARTQLPYFLQLTPDIFAPLAKLLATLLQLSQSQENDHEQYIGGIRDLLVVVQTHLATMTLLRLETTRSRDALAILGDALLLVVFTLTKTTKARANTDQAVSYNPQTSSSSSKDDVSTVDDGLMTMDTTGVEPRRGLGKRTKSEFRHPNSSVGSDDFQNGINNDNNIIPIDPFLVTVDRLPSSFEPGTHQGGGDELDEKASLQPPEVIAARMVTQYLRLFARSTHAQNKFLANLWKKARSKTSSSESILQLKRFAAEALVGERSISYLICQSADSPRPNQDVPSSKRRLAHVLGVPGNQFSRNHFHRVQARPVSELYPPSSYSSNVPPSPMARNKSNIEDSSGMDYGSGGPTLKRGRYSTTSRRDSIQNRVRVRSVLGEGNNRNSNSSLLKRRSQALLTIQRAARSFIDAGREHQQNNGDSSGNLLRGKNLLNGTSGSNLSEYTSNGSYASMTPSTPSSTQSRRERKPVLLEEVENVLTSGTQSLTSGKIPTRIMEWVQDPRGVVTMQTQYSMGNIFTSDPSPPLENDLEKIAELVPEGFSLTSTPSILQGNEEQIDLNAVLLQSIADCDDVPSAVVLRCIQDDLISRMLVFLQSQKLDPSGTKSLHQEKVEQALLSHCKALFSTCLTKCYRSANANASATSGNADDSQNQNPTNNSDDHDDDDVNKKRGGAMSPINSSNLPSSPSSLPPRAGDRGKVSSPFERKRSSGAHKWVIEDIACEFMERLAVLSDEWPEGADYLGPILLEMLQDTNTPMYMKICINKLLCSFAKGKIKLQNASAVIDEAIENLLLGPLFVYPSTMKDEETMEVFLLDLARSPPQTIHQSMAQALHHFVSKRPEVRMLTAQARGKPSMLEDAVRISAAAYLKHTGMASLAYQLAYEVGDILGSSDNGINNINVSEFPSSIVRIWKAAWEITHAIISVYRRSQKRICAEPGCHHPVVEDNGSWRCEEGHTSDDFEVEEVYSYQEICANVASRARILLNQGAGANCTYGSEDDVKDILNHAKRFISSGASDGIKADRLEIYLKAKSRHSVYREQGLKLLRDVLGSLVRLKMTRSTKGPSNVDPLNPEIRNAAIQAVAGDFSSLKGRGSFDADITEKLRQAAAAASEVNLTPTLESIRDVFMSMGKHPDSPGHHALDYQIPSAAAISIQKVTHELIDLLLEVAERAALGGCGSPVASIELATVLEVFQKMSIKVCDHAQLVKIRLIPRMIGLVTSCAYLNDRYLQGAAWSVFSRMALQIMVSNWGDGEGNGDEDDPASYQFSLLEPSFSNGFDELQRCTALAVFSQLNEGLKSLKDPRNQTYEVEEMLCHRFLCLLGAMCNRASVILNFSALINSAGESKDNENLLLGLISCPSPRIQQLAIRLGRRLFVQCDAEKIVPPLFKLAGEWSLSLKGYTCAGRSADLALECVGMLRYLAGKHENLWRPAIINECGLAATKYLETAPNSSNDVLCRFWTTFAILNMSAPSTLRPGSRVKVVPGSGSGWSESKQNLEYGIIIRAARRAGSPGSKKMPFLDHYENASCMIILDSDATKIPTKHDAEKLIPVTIVHEEYKHLVVSMRGCSWLLDSIELFTTQFWNSSLQHDMVFCELKSMAMNVLHSWLSTDAAHAIKQIASVRPHVWRKIVAICAYPAPTSSLENIDDLASTSQAFVDLKSVLCELGVSPIDSVEHRLMKRGGTKSRQPILRGGAGDEVPEGDANTSIDSSSSQQVDDGTKTIVHDGEIEFANEKDGEEDEEGEFGREPGGGSDESDFESEDKRRSLLSTPLLQPGRRSALARQASTQMFPNKLDVPPSPRLAGQGIGSTGGGGDTAPTSEDHNPTSQHRSSHENVDGTRPSSPSLQEMVSDGKDFEVPALNQPRNQTLRRNSSGSNGGEFRRRVSRSYSGSVGNVPISSGGGGRPKKSVKFEPPSKTESALETPFREMDRGDQSSYIFELHVERNRRRARMERKRRAARRLRTLSSSSAMLPSDSMIPATSPRSNSVARPLLRVHEDGSVPLPSLCQPDTPRGRDAATLTLPVELPTVDTMLSVPVSTLGSGSAMMQKRGGIHHNHHHSRAVVKEGTLLRISSDESGVVKQVKSMGNGQEMAFIETYNSKTGFQSSTWRDIGDLELSEDIIADRYRLFMGTGTEDFGSRGPIRRSSSFRTKQQQQQKRSEEAKEKLVKELRHICSRSAILNARRGAVAAISGSVGSTESEIEQMQLLVGEAGGAAQILGMLKLCESSSSSDFPHSSDPSAVGLNMDRSPSSSSSSSSSLSSSSPSSSSGIWRAVAVLFETNDDFADMLLDEAILHLSITAKDTLFFETPHPLCPVEELEDSEDGLSFDESEDDEISVASPPYPTHPPNIANAIGASSSSPGSSQESSGARSVSSSGSVHEYPVHEEDEEDGININNNSNGNPLPPPPPLPTVGDEASSMSLSQNPLEGVGISSTTTPVPSPCSTPNPPSTPSSHGSSSARGRNLSSSNQEGRSSSAGAIIGDEGSEQHRTSSQHYQPSRSSSVASTARKLSGSHRFCIKGASGLLVEFDRRSSIISAATQVTLSYDPQDREVIKVLGERGADAWQPVVVSGDTCYIHWNVNQTDILKAMQRMEELHVDIHDVAWGVAVRVRSLDEISNVDEMQVLEKPFGWRLMRVIADNASRVLSRGGCGIHFFDTAVSYLRSKHLAFKPELCEVLTLLVKARMEEIAQWPFSRWDDIMRHGLYKLHHDLLILFDEVAEDGFTSVSPYFVCLLELLVLCRSLWALHPDELKNDQVIAKYLRKALTNNNHNVDPSIEKRLMNHIKAPLCSLVIFGRRENSKVVVDCATCGLRGSHAICIACAATCHAGHEIHNERTTSHPCGCSLRGPDFCCALRPLSDVWKIMPTDRTWFDVVCQTADVIDCISTMARPIPQPFIRESYRTCEDGKLLRLCLRSLEECLRSEVQDVWWDREARHMWANMLDQGMDSVSEVAFGLKVLVSSLLPSAFVFWWQNRKDDWMRRIHTNQAWALAQAMLQFNYALAPAACYSEWDSRLHNWTTTLAGIADLGGEDSCTFLLTREFPRPQVYLKCRTCSLEICEHCAKSHAASNHDLSEETYGPGFCDSRTEPKEEDQKPVYEQFSQLAMSHFDTLHDLYWTNHDSEVVSDDQVPTEPRTLAALLNIPCTAFSLINDETDEDDNDDDEEENTDKDDDDDDNDEGGSSPGSVKTNQKLIRCTNAPDCASLLSPCLEGILIELLGIKEDSTFLCVGADLDHGFSLSIGALLACGCRKYGGTMIHGLATSARSATKIMLNMDTLRTKFGVPLGRITAFTGDIVQHAQATVGYVPKGKKRSKHHTNNSNSAAAAPAEPNQGNEDEEQPMLNGEMNAQQRGNDGEGEDESTTKKTLEDESIPTKEEPKGIEGMLPQYDRIFVNGVCTLEQLDALSAMLPLDGALLCPMVDSLGYGIYVQRNQFTGECENRTLAPLYEDSEKFLKEIATLKPITFKKDWTIDEMENERWERKEEMLERQNLQLAKEAKDRASLFDQIGHIWPLDSWISLADFAGRLAGRETASLGFRDISKKAIEAQPLLHQVENVEIVRGRFAVLKRINDSLSEVLPLINLTPQYSAGGLGKQLAKSNMKRLIFLSTKLDAWSKVLEPCWSDAPPNAMPSITVSRKLADIGLHEDSLFMQTYNQVQNFPLSALRRRDQSFKVRFAGEYGHDVGGLYRDLFSEMCGELREGRPPLLFHPSTTSKELSDRLLPRPSLISPMESRLYEFLGSLVGIACLRHGITLSFDVSPLVWKILVKDQLSEQDLRYVDDAALQAVSFIRRGSREDFETVFPDTVFALAPIDFDLKPDSNEPVDDITAEANVVELCPLGKELKVNPDNALEYARLVEGFRLSECKTQISSLQRGIAPLVPVRLLPMFTWQELENLVCGVADVDVEFLHSRTKYVGGVKITDSHIKFFWDVLSNEFTPEDRTQFLKFVWGRERMSTAEEGSTFVIGPHLRARDSGNPDKWLPVAHTCFFSLDLPAYSSREITKSRLLFAMNNSVSIDGDDTAEGVANRSLNIE